MAASPNDSVVTAAVAAVMAHLGEMAISLMLGFIGWVMTTFAKRHLEAMDKLSQRMDTLTLDVSKMGSDIRSLREHQERTDERVKSLEDDDLK